MQKRISFLLIFLSFFMFAHSQYYTTGAEPFSIKWKQIKTDNFQIIFPKEFEDKAKSFAAKMDYAYDFVNKSMPSKSRKLSVIIHPHSAYSNGSVAWAPRRMELWPTSPQSNGSQEWMEHLILHETRHFVQENKMNQGITKVLKVILGEQAEMIPLGLYTRGWFMEGDAVATETALSKSGRGRQPSFEQGMRALTLEKGIQGYDEAHLGTYRFYMPNYYEVGYHTVAVNRLYKDSLIFERKMNQFPRFKTLRGFRDGGKNNYYGFAIDYLNNKWRAQDSDIAKTPYKNILSEEKDYYTYESLQEDKGLLFAMKKSYSKTPEIVSIDSLGNEREILKVGWLSEEHFCVSNGKICYVDRIPNPRWENSFTADIFVFDIKSGERRRVTKGQIYQTPSQSADASMIIAQHVSKDGKYQLHILDAANGDILQHIPNPQKQFYISLTWSPDDASLAYIAQEKDEKSIKIYDIATQKEEVLVEDSYEEIGSLLWDGDFIYYTGSYSGINNIYACNVKTKEVKRLTSARFAADFATILDGKLYYSNYTSDGFRPVKHLPSDVANEQLADVKYMGLGIADKLSKQEGGAVDFSKAKNDDYEVKKYSRALNLFRFHSWFPALTADETSIYPHLILLSHNKLNTSFLQASYNANPASSTERFKISYEYQGFYPKLALDVAWGSFEQKLELAPDVINIGDVIVRPSVSIPSIFKKGVYNIRLNNKLYGEFVSLYSDKINYKENYFTVGAISSFTRSHQSSDRDLFSPYLQALSLSFAYEDVYDSPYKFAAGAKIYTPGFFKHHSLQLNTSYQHKDIKSFNSLQNLPRGYVFSDNTDLLYGSLDYYFPIAYPDFNIASILYLKRCSFGLYGDAALIGNAGVCNEFLGAGGSFFVDMCLLRYEVDFRLGYQFGVASSPMFDKLNFPGNFIMNFTIL